MRSTLIFSLASSVAAVSAATVPFGAKSVPFLVPRGGADDLPPSSDTSLEDMMKQAGMDSSQLDELMKSMPGGGEGMPSMEESMKAMSEMMESPMFSEYMNDPEKLEESRQMILQNPMMKQMMGSMPGFEEILNDADKWRETMQAAGDMYKNMAAGGGLESMLEGMGGAGGMPGMPGLDSLMGGMGGAGTLGGNDALDELSEGED
mmetsp:Transcript_13845/g.23017  ORF Transcript_13845/g.23017 Transcript_13845/m.23017 type:complete len:205 (-) Transcript_13845:66-680(-)|eukprot:CAMPEP_0181048128 /NCGR_PEP_ID=MMETSP1070-20121207/15262_1 /TAXON_ID=265543 /ORGANISM="Minutocellus polymorphus, Strain NH13" /LENGTH=204 /DNA_ID=CAMNT_0023126875 /DNA_START=82 /DNA_END=696 /DNA_ORIENTATION=-